MIPFNTRAFYTLLLKEVRRFGKVWLQTVLSPLVSTSLYFLVFGLALGSRLKTVGDVPYMSYVVPGLMMLAMVNAAFLNASSSLFQAKINGTIVDLLVAPIGASELLLAHLGASVFRALLVGGLVWLVASVFTGFQLLHPGWALFFSVAVAATFAQLGLLTAIFAHKFDHLAIFPNFVLTPLTFLGGVFYSIDMLPEPWRSVSRLNPIFYTVNGLRYGLLGASDASVLGSACAIGMLLLALTALSAKMLESGTGLRQ